MSSPPPLSFATNAAEYRPPPPNPPDPDADLYESEEEEDPDDGNAMNEGRADSGQADSGQKIQRKPRGRPRAMSSSSEEEPEISEYEAARMARIKRNNERLQQLGLMDMKDTMLEDKAAEKAERQYSRDAKRARRMEEEGWGSRKSERGEYVEEVDEERENEKELARERAETKRTDKLEYRRTVTRHRAVGASLEQQKRRQTLAVLL